MASILIVDDEPSILFVLSKLLEQNSHVVTKVDDGTKAQALIDSEEEYDLAVFDVRMSPIDGLELLAYAREKRPELKVIMLSAYCGPEPNQKAMDLGACVCVAKPFDMDDIVEAVESQLVPTD